MMLVVDTFNLPSSARIDGIRGASCDGQDLSQQTPETLYAALRGCCVAARLSGGELGCERDLSVVLYRAQVIGAELARRAAGRPAVVLTRDQDYLPPL